MYTSCSTPAFRIKGIDDHAGRWGDDDLGDASRSARRGAGWAGIRVPLQIEHCAARRVTGRGDRIDLRVRRLAAYRHAELVALPRWHIPARAGRLRR